VSRDGGELDGVKPLAGAAGMPRPAFVQRFKQKVGQSPRD
jgi:hypothetical protein